MNAIPSGTVTFLFTDIEGSTKLAQEHPDEMPILLARHHEILNRAIEVRNGYVFQIAGDSFSAAFSSASDAINAALSAQRNLQNETWTPAPIKVRMGIHTGTAQIDENKQYAEYAALATTQRIMSAGHGGQVLISNATQQLLRNDLSDGLSLRDMGECRLKDLIRPEHLYQLVSPDLPADFPPLKTLPTYRHNLPTQVTSFIGRAHEINEITKLITEHRVVTLTGSGGAGKTRLSLQVGAEDLEQFPNGVWFVELASLTEPSLIVGAVVSALGLQEKDNDMDALAKYVGDQALLLILDNCEHLIEDCARLVEALIQACPKLRVLASSREALGIAGEHPYHVPSLPFPNPKQLPELDEIAKFDSVELFVERVRTYTPSFSLTDKNAPAVVQICSRLDGMPLALELAAARVKVMSVEQLALRLGDVFNLLTSGSRTALPRQQTLRALIEWSYDLLSDSEKRLFRKLSAFSGGWSLEAAESICSAEGGASILNDLARLVDTSLVVKEEHDGDARFHMLETIRQYAEYKMFASEEVEEVKNRHRDWFMQLAEEAEPKLRTHEQLIWLRKLEMEHDNFRAAMTWSIEQQHLEQALRIPSALANFWEIHGHEEEGRKWFEQALKLDVDAKKKHPHAWATAVHGIASISTSTPQFQSYQTQVREAADIFREQGDDFRLAHALYHLAYFPHFAGELSTAIKLYEESFVAYKKINDSWGMGNCLHCIAHVEEQKGKGQEAHELFGKSLELLKSSGDRWYLYHPVGDTGRIAVNRGDLDVGKQIYLESLQTYEELGNRGWFSASLRQLARISYLRGDFDEAIAFAEQSLEIARTINDRSELAWAHFRLWAVHWSQGEFGRAREDITSAVSAMAQTSDQANLAYLKGETGDQADLSYLRCIAWFMECHGGKTEQSRRNMELEFEGIRRRSPEDAPEILVWLGQAMWLEKDYVRAQVTFQEAVTELYEFHYFIRIPECLEGLGKIAVAQNQLERGARLFGAAEAMREKMGTPIPPVMRGDYDAHVQSLGTAYESSWSQGRGTTMEQAIALALQG